MNLGDLRTEVLAHGFDPIVFGTRTTVYLNDAYTNICRRISFFGSEDTLDFSTAGGTATYPQPTDLAKDRSLRDTSRNVELQAVGLRDIDRAPNRSGTPNAYALDSFNLHLYPTPDSSYPLELRYWKIPADMVADTDEPSSLPSDYHTLLIYWALKECFAADDDIPTAQYWEQQYDAGVRTLAADLKFPNDDQTHQLGSMWEAGGGLSGVGTGQIGNTSGDDGLDGGTP